MIYQLAGRMERQPKAAAYGNRSTSIVRMLPGQSRCNNLRIYSLQRRDVTSFRSGKPPHSDRIVIVIITVFVIHALYGAQRLAVIGMANLNSPVYIRKLDPSSTPSQLCL